MGGDDEKSYYDYCRVCGYQRRFGDRSRHAGQGTVYKAADVFTWTGCYIGAHIGGGWAHKTFDGGPFTAAVPNGFGVGATTIVGVSNTNYSFDPGSFLGGGQVGCDYQVARNWVFGVEVEGSWVNLRDSAAQTTPIVGTIVAAPNGSATGLASYKANFIGTFTDRIGYTWDRSMIYAKGGLAVVRDQYSFSGQASTAI
jgi:outer membrane immunogenic protein